MNTFEEFKKLKREKKIQDDLVSKRNQEKWRVLDEEENKLFKKIITNLEPFHGQTVDGLRLSIIINKKDVSLLVNGKKYAKFYVKRHSYSCACEGPCEHETNYWHTISVNTLSDKGGEKGIYFNDGLFAQSMIDLLNSYRYRNW